MKDIILESLGKIDSMFNNIPIAIYAVAIMLCSAILIQAVYEYSTQEEPVNFTFVYTPNDMDYYQGPVPQGYNSEHYRNTGETILEDNE